MNKLPINTKVKRGLIPAIASILLLVAVGLPANADDINLQLNLNAATVYPQSATVTRSGQVHLPPGEHQLLIEGLPPRLNPGLVQMSIADNNVRLGSLDIKQVYQRDLVAEEERRLNEEIQSLKDQRQVRADQKEAAELQLKALSGLVEGSSHVLENEKLVASDLATIIGTIGSQAVSARSQVLEATIAIRELDQTLRERELELRQIATRAKQTSLVSVQVRADAAVETNIAISYPIDNARWEWLYEARLDTRSGDLAFFRQAAVAQVSGESWDGIELTLSTTQPRRNANTPELEPLFADVFDPSPVAREPRRSQEALDEVVVTGSLVREDMADVASPVLAFDAATMTATQYMAEYKIPGRVSLPSAEQQKVVPVDQHRFETALVARTVPEIDNHAYVEARFEYDNNVPMHGGQVQLYRDGALVGSRFLDSLLPGAEVRFPFGIDDRIKVEVRQEQEESGEGGLLRRKEEQQHRVRYEVTSYHESPTTVEIVGRIPVARDKSISVEIPSGATPASTTDLDGKSGVLLWSAEISPGKTNSIQHYYDLSFPRDKRIRYQ
ncbi:MAG: mucoidy inhibitor MuiA family protein [Cellvibrionaceae bacterium]